MVYEYFVPKCKTGMHTSTYIKVDFAKHGEILKIQVSTTAVAERPT